MKHALVVMAIPNRQQVSPRAQGRLVVLGEAGMLTAQIDGRSHKNFGMNVPGIDNKQLALNIMHWLSRLT